MKNISKILLACFILSASVSSAQSQNFPATEKEITEILCTGKWQLKTLGKGEKTMPASEAGMEFVIAFKKRQHIYK